MEADLIVFKAWDYIIMAATMILSLIIGLYFRFTGGKQKTNEEYLHGDRNMSILPVAVSVMASVVSAVTILGGTSENYYYGMIYIITKIGFIGSTVISYYVFLPVFFGLQKTTTYEYLELRFGPRMRMAASLMYTFQMIFYNSIVMYAPAIVLEAVTGLNRLISILAVGLACTVYSAFGGMKAVVFTDLLQSALMFGAILSVIVVASVQLGGFDKIFIEAGKGGRLNFSNFSIDPTERHTVWSLLIGASVTHLTYAVNQTQVQRLLTVSTLERSQKSLVWSWFIHLVISVAICVCGIAMYAHYRDCDPLTAGRMTAIDQLMARYVVDAMRGVPGLAGLFVAGIFSASLSTLSASCNSMAAVTISDYISRFNISPSYFVWLTKLIAFVYGIMFVGLAFFAENLGGILQASITISGTFGGPLLGAFTLGMCTTYANESGAIVSMLSALALLLWKNFGTPRPAAIKLPLSVEGCLSNVTIPALRENVDQHYFYLYRISYQWNSLIGLLWVLVVGSVVSLLWRHQQPWERAGRASPDPALFTPLLAKRLRARGEGKQDVRVPSKR